MNNNSNNSSNKLIYIILAVIILISIIVIIILLILGLKNKKINKSPMIVPENILANKSSNYKLDVKDINIGRFTISLWMYIEEWNYNIGEKKVILTTNNNKNLLYLDKYKNDLIYQLNIYEANSNTTEREIRLKNIPLQKWNNVILIVKDRTVEMYLNGTLKKTHLLDSPPSQIKKLNVLPTNNHVGFYGQISKLQFFYKELKYIDVQNIFQSGPY